MVVSETIGLILLAAGGSSRLGRPKQLLGYEGQPLLRRAAETALASQCQPVIVVLGAQAEACAAVLQGLGGAGLGEDDSGKISSGRDGSPSRPLRIVVNADWPEGLASSIHAGLNVLKKENPAITAAILSVADQPHLTAPLFNSLIERHRATGKKIVAAQYAGVPGPPALFCASLFPQLQTLQGDEGARRVLQANPGEVELVPFPNGALDVDTIGDYEKLRLKESVGRVLSLLVAGKYTELESLTKGVRLSAKEMTNAISAYGRELALPQDDDFQLIDIVEVRNVKPQRWSVTMPLRTHEEGRSDLSIEMTFIEQQAGFAVELDDIHVL